MKIVSDFDGVLTDQTEEGARVLEIFGEMWAALSDISPKEVSALVDKGLREMELEPFGNGWRVKGRLTAFANEDLFIRNNGLAAWMDEHAGKPALQALRLRGVESFMKLAQLAYEKMVSESQAAPKKPMDQQAKEVFDQFLRAGHQVVVVSNSSTSRILDMFHAVGIEAKDHAQDPTARIRVRGGAAKFELGDVSEGFKLGNYFLETSRPRYAAILREEKPDAVIGDVFSLDLALPYFLANSEKSLPPVKLFLRLRPYTPSWAREEACALRGERARVYPIRELTEIPALL